MVNNRKRFWKISKAWNLIRITWLSLASKHTNKGRWSRTTNLRNPNFINTETRIKKLKKKVVKTYSKN